MNHAVDVDAEGVRVPLARRRVVEIAQVVLRAQRIGEARLSITFVGSRRMAALNRRHLGHQGPTDVISFALTTSGGPVVGDIYVAPEVARRNAGVNGVPLREELTRLVVHGVLHVSGLDHPEGEGRLHSAMWRRQEQLVHRLTRRSSRGPARARSAA